MKKVFWVVWIILFIVPYVKATDFYLAGTNYENHADEYKFTAYDKDGIVYYYLDVEKLDGEFWVESDDGSIQLGLGTSEFISDVYGNEIRIADKKTYTIMSVH